MLHLTFRSYIACSVLALAGMSVQAGADPLTAPTQTIDVGGSKIAYRTFGPDRPTDPVPLLLLQRFRGTLDDWDPAFLTALSVHRKVILFNNSGVSTSTGQLASTVEEMAIVSSRFARTLGLATFDVLGWSMGGFVAQALAVTDAASVRKVILIGTGPAGSEEHQLPAAGVFDVAVRPTYGFNEQLYLFFVPGKESETRASMSRLAERTDGRDEPATLEVLQTQASAIQNFMGGKGGEFAKLKQLKQLKQPTLIVSGDRDPFFPMKNVWLLYRELASGQLWVLPNAGHAPHHQEPAEVARAINAFLGAAPQ